MGGVYLNYTVSFPFEKPSIFLMETTNMGLFTSLLPTESERNLQIGFIDEGMRLYGIEAVLIDVDSVSFYADNQKLSGREKHIHILFQNHPDRRLLANMQFNHIEKNEQPVVVFIPFQFGGVHIDVVKDQVLVIGSDNWIIRSVNSTYFTGLWYVCHVVPFMREEDRPRDTARHKSQFFNPGEDEFE